MKNEIWRDIPSYIGFYAINNLGEVKSLPRKIVRNNKGLLPLKQKILNPSKRNGYKHISLYKKGIGKTYSIHQLMAITFLNHKPNKDGFVVDHIDNNPNNNNINNLQLITFRKNSSKDKVDCSSKLTGVAWDKYSKKWKCQIQIKSKSYHLGNFTNESDASKEYDSVLSYYNKYGIFKKEKIKTKTSRFIGVSFHKSSKKWRATLTKDKKQIYLGLYKTEIEAKEAYEKYINNIEANF